MTEPEAAWTLRGRFRKLTAGFALVMVLLVAIIALASTRFVLAGNAVVNRWQPARLAGETLVDDLVNQETGLRGYQITHQQAALAPYRHNLSGQVSTTARFRSLVGHDQRIESELHLFVVRVAQWRAGYVQPTLAHQGRLPSTLPAASDAGRALFNRIRAAAGPLNRTIDSRVSSSKHDRLLTGEIAIVAIGLGVLFVIGTGLVVRRGLHRGVLGPVESLADQTRLVAQGELTRRIEPNGPAELVQLGDDVEAMRSRLIVELAHAERITEDLRRQGAELERSNADLQQFAYVASHDLSEPLRKVSNFCQLLERQYGEQLDDRARQYIAFAVDGAKRMQALINDLLSLSRVGRATESFVPVDLDKALDLALTTLADAVADAGATVLRETALPTIAGDRTLLVSLFQNLVGNAVKYRRDDVAPVIRISAGPLDPQGWTIRVADNGIGIDPQYAQRIFAVFQRLHLRDQYGGTGIGLALCRRIVEFHGGRIELDIAASGAATGATFVITIEEGEPRAELPIRSDDP